MASNGNSAPSVGLFYNDTNDTGDIITNDIYVPKSGLTETTYYCALQFNANKGGGYCGIQNSSKGRAFIFSIWDPIKNIGEPITTPHLHPGTTAERFDPGLGLGLKTMNFTLGWEPDTWMTFCLRRWDRKRNAHTRFGLWIQKHSGSGKGWYHLATLDFPLPNVYFNRRTVSSISDWGGHGNQIRQAHFRQCFKRLAPNEWKSLDMVKVKRNSPDPDAANFINKYKATSTNEYFHVLSGGTDTPDNRFNGLFEVLQVNQNPIPNMRFEITKSVYESVTKTVKWEIDSLSSPQFSYTIKIEGNELPTRITSTDRSVQLTINKGLRTHIIFESIYGEKKGLDLTQK